MKTYFDEKSSIANCTDGSVEAVLSAVANRFTKANPRGPLTFRAYSKRGIQRADDYRYDADFDTFFPFAENGECVFSWAAMWAETDQEMIFDINCYGPLVVFLDGEIVWQSTMFSERYADQVNWVTIPLKQGWNNFVLRAKKTRAGFGWKFGSWIGKHPYVFMMPSSERQGQEGWLFSSPSACDAVSLPNYGDHETATALEWNPDADWSDAHLKAWNCARIFGDDRGKTALAWTRITTGPGKTIPVTLSGRHAGDLRLLCDGKEIFVSSDGTIAGEFELMAGTHELFALSTGTDEGWGFDLQVSGPDGVLETACPCALQGRDAAWLFSGPFDPDQVPDLDRITDLFQVHQTTDGAGYWRLDAPDMYVRLYNENALFGHWNYPLGVTLYGILQAAMETGSDELRCYVQDHVQFCCSTYPYSKWDHDTFDGATHIHHLLSSIDSLDDCGSFGSCMLETAAHCEIEGYEPIARLVGDFISNQQDRFEDGAFQRRKLMHSFHNQTMWADDLYMSVPFLCRYYKLTGDRRYIDDAANQIFGFKKRLYIPGTKIMSHVYDIDRKMATGVPWGRGNGWVLFSLSELLMVLPEDHAQRSKLIRFFGELCSGYLALQGPEGMWRQVLTHPESYLETSCTAMFICAFSRGIRHGWLEALAPEHPPVPTLHVDHQNILCHVVVRQQLRGGPSEHSLAGSALVSPRQLQAC